jgi:glycogen synthase
MRILHITVEYPPVVHGGLGTAVGGLVEASDRAGLDVRVLLVNDAARAAYGPTAFPGRSADAAGNARFVTTTSWAGAYDRATSLLREWRPDVLHLHVFWLWPLARRLQHDMDLPIVYTVHSLDRAEYEIGHGPPECLAQWNMQAAAIIGADRVIALSRSEERLLKTYCPDAAARVKVVGNGITVPDRNPIATCRQWAPLILFTGRFVDRKGIRDLLAAIPLVLAEAPDTAFVLAGGQRGCAPDETDHWWRPHQLRDVTQLRFLGWLDAEQINDWYQAADILIVPSWYEPFGMVILEGMKHGLAIAATAVGGPAEILINRHTGLLFPARKPDALAAALLTLITQPALRARLGAAAHREVKRKWDWTVVIKQFPEVYREAGGSRTRR